jgi:hypothetical protein
MEDRVTTSKTLLVRRNNNSKGALNWTPPDQLQKEEAKDGGAGAGADVSYYGAGDKRERDNRNTGTSGTGDEDINIGDRPEKNPRFLED